MATELNPVVREAIERLSHVDAYTWDEVTSVVEAAKENGGNAGFDALDCTLLLDLLWLYRHARPVLEHAAINTAPQINPAHERIHFEVAYESLPFGIRAKEAAFHIWMAARAHGVAPSEPKHCIYCGVVIDSGAACTTDSEFNDCVNKRISEHVFGVEEPK